MKSIDYTIEIISAPSILGLKPGGVEKLGESLLGSGLAAKLRSPYPVIHVPTLNGLYNGKRNEETNILNVKPLRDFSLILGEAVSITLNKNTLHLF